MIPLIFFIGFAGMSDCVKDHHARIGNYTSVIPHYDLCGYSRDWLKQPNHCFKNHPLYSEPILNGRRALNGEAPWIVHLEMTVDYPWWNLFNFDSTSSCTGALISNQWVLTAAHCYKPELDESKKIVVRLGTEYLKGKAYTASNRPLLHPKFSTDYTFDAMLIKLDEQVQFEHTGDYYMNNAICLPPTTLYPITSEFWELVFMSGWGVGHDNYLRIATYKLFMALYPSQMGEYVKIRMDHVHGGIACSGDSGAPFWQYYDGKAVILGVFRGGSETCIGSVYGIYVPTIMDWILQNISK